MVKHKKNPKRPLEEDHLAYLVIHHQFVVSELQNIGFIVKLAGM